MNIVSNTHVSVAVACCDRPLACSLVWVLAGCSELPEPALRDSQNNELTLISKAPSWLVINYWADWCSSCREEMPELNALAKADNNIRVWGVDFDNPDSLDELNKKISALGIDFPVVAPAYVPQLELENPPALPATYIVAPDGSVKEGLIGSRSRKELEQIVKGFAA